MVVHIDADQQMKQVPVTLLPDAGDGATPVFLVLRRW